MRTSGNTFIASIDFWPPSLNALEVATRFARQFNGKVTVVHVVEKSFHYPEELSIDADTFAEDLERALKNLVRPYAEQGITIDYELRRGDVTRQLTDVLHDHEADAVFVGIREGRYLDDIFIGTHTLHLVKAGEIPVVVVDAAPNDPEIQTILIPYDRRSGGGSVLAFLEELEQPMGSSVVIITAMGPGEQEEDVKAAANGFADQLEGKGITNIEIEIVKDEDPYQAIMEQLRVDVGQFDMVLLEHPDHAALGELTLGSLVEEVVTKGRMPVVCLPVKR